MFTIHAEAVESKHLIYRRAVVILISSSLATASITRSVATPFSYGSEFDY